MCYEASVSTGYVRIVVLLSLMVMMLESNGRNTRVMKN